MKHFYRGITYCIGLVLLALGIILNTKTNLGVSPIITIPYSISNIFKINLGNSTLFIYTLFVLCQLLLRGKNFHAFDLLQIPMSIIFSRLINIFNNIINIHLSNLPGKLILLAIAIILTGIGAAVSVEMNLVPNAADGLTQALGEKTGKSLGLAKNIVDLSCIIITLIISLVFAGKIVGIGIGTLAAVLGVGRSIAIFNMLFKQKMLSLVN